MQSMMAASKYNYQLLAKLSSGTRPDLSLSKRGADLSRGPQALSKLPNAAWTNTWPAPSSSLDLDFANNRGFVRGSGQGGAMDAVTFTRASSGNWVDQNGVLRTGAGTFTGTANALGVNLVSNPQNFENASWTKSRVTYTSNALIAPDNTLTAGPILETATTGQHDIYTTSTIGITANTNYTLSAYVKTCGRNYVTLDVWNGTTTWFSAAFNLTDGSLVVSGANGGTFVSYTSSNVGNDWWRFSITGTFSTSVGGYSDIIITDTAPTSFANYGVPNNASYAGDPTKGLYIWGAQLEVGSSATTYYPTNINAPRFDWASTTQLPQNLLLYSQQFDNAYWSKGQATIAADATTAPDSTSTADKFSATSAAGGKSVANTSISLSNTAYTWSVYAKASELSWFALNAYDGTNRLTYFDLTNGVVGTNASGSTASITSVGSGWYRCVVTRTATATATGGIGLNLASADNVNSFTTTAGNGIFIWGAQLELGSSATTYLATGAQILSNTPLVANSTCNGLLIEESRTNRLLWCRDATVTPNRNILARSEEFDNASWVKTRITATANTTTAPNGTNTADTIAANATSASGDWIEQNVSSGFGNNITLSVYAKSNASSWVLVTINSLTGKFASAWVNLSTGTVGTVTQATYSAPTVAVTADANGFYRITLSTTTDGLDTKVVIFVPNADNTISATSGDSIYLWGAQIERGTSASTYEQTTTTGSIWSKLNVTVAKTATGIDGVVNSATTITATANNGSVIQPITLASGSRTSSVYLKRITGTGTVQVTMDGSTWSTVDLSNGLWNRIVLSATVTNPCVGILIATNGDAVAMDYGQIEDGAFATSPILTTTATATRSQDNASISSAITPLIDATEGTVISNHGANLVSLAQCIYSFNRTGFALTLFTGTQGGVSAFTLDVTGARLAQFDTRPSITRGVSIGSYRTGYYAFCHNNSFTSNQVSSNGIVPNTSGLSITIGTTNTFTSPLNGPIRRLSFISGPKTQDAMRALFTSFNT